MKFQMRWINHNQSVIRHFGDLARRLLLSILPLVWQHIPLNALAEVERATIASEKAMP